MPEEVKPLTEVMVIGKTKRGGEPFPISRQRGLYYFIPVEELDWLREVNDAYKTLYRAGIKPLDRIKIVGRGGIEGYRPFLLKGHYGRYLCILAEHLRQLEEINRVYTELLEARGGVEEKRRELEAKRERAKESVENAKKAVEAARDAGAPQYASELMRHVDEFLVELEVAFSTGEYDRAIELASKTQELALKAKAEALSKIETAKKVEVKKPPEELGRYVYCVIPSPKEKLSFGNIGVKGSGEVYTISYGPIAAVVSDAPMKEYVLTEDNVRVHNQVINRVMENHTVVPMAFGQVFKNGKILGAVLEKVRADIKKALGVAEGKVELGVKVILPKGAGLDEDAFASDIKDLHKIAAQSRLGRRFSQRLILNTFYLVTKEKINEFSEAVGKLVDKYKQLKIQYTGPWPPFNFATINVRGT